VENTSLTIANNGAPLRAPGMREYVAMGFRWRRRMVFVFAVTALTGALVAFFAPPDYESTMKILVSRERLDPLIAADQVPASAPRAISEEELNSEVELIKNDDVLRKVVAATGLQNKLKPALGFHFLDRAFGKSDEIRKAKAVRELATELTTTLPKKSNIITVSYRSKDGKQSTAVLAAVSRFYLEKHMEVHRPRGQFQFFDQQVDRTRQKLSEVQEKLNASSRKAEVFAGPIELDLAVQKLADQRLALQQTYTAIRETEKRIGSLEERLTSTPARMTTAVRTADNPELMVQLKSTLLQLELKRTDLLQKFQPTHRNVQEVEEQITQAQAAIAAAQNAPVTDRTTDRDPTYEWMRSELAKARTDLISLRARALSLAKYTAQYTDRARALSEDNLQQQQWLSTAKALEDAYQLYLRKREEARISDVLDQNQILNVSMAQLPSLPILPTHAPTGIAIGAIFFALVLSAGTGFVSEHLDNSFRTPDEVQRYLEIPVIASLPMGEVDDNGGLGQRRGAYEQIL
jgi:uncharacterized protein involved in exopolysaccharide biosynthesis